MQWNAENGVSHRVGPKRGGWKSQGGGREGGEGGWRARQGRSAVE